MKVIPAAEHFNQVCSCGVTLVVGYSDIGEDMHDGGYGFSCPNCYRYHRIKFKELPESIQRQISRAETGH